MPSRDGSVGEKPRIILPFAGHSHRPEPLADEAPVPGVRWLDADVGGLGAGAGAGRVVALAGGGVAFGRVSFRAEEDASAALALRFSGGLVNRRFWPG